MSFHFIFEIFFDKNHKKITVENVRKYDKSIKYFEKKKRFSSFQKAYLTMLEGAKYPGGSGCLVRIQL